MSKEFVCTLDNTIDENNIIEDNDSKSILSVQYSTIDPKTVLTEEEATSLQELIHEVIEDLFHDVTTVFPEIDGLDISIYKDNEENKNS